MGKTVVTKKEHFFKYLAIFWQVEYLLVEYPFDRILSATDFFNIFLIRNVEYLDKESLSTKQLKLCRKIHMRLI